MRLADSGRAWLLVPLAAAFFLCFNSGLVQSLHKSFAPKVITQPAILGAVQSASASRSLSFSDDYLPSVCVQGMYHWTENKLPIKVCISSGDGVPGYRPQFNQMIRNAFDCWCQASADKLSWQEVSDPKSADVVVGWTDQPTQRANGTEAGETNAYARLDQASGRGIIYGAKMSILTELSGQPFTDQFMDKTILHETGHALGLQGHSPVRTDIMYYAINNDQQAALTARDRATMAHLYADYPQNGNIAAK